MTIAERPITTVNPVVTPPAQASPPAVTAATHHGFSFSDFLDIINPLQHIPVVSTIYRAITHDTIDTPEKITGDTLFGGLLGFVSSVADTAFESVTGKNFGDTVLSLFTGDHASKTTIPTEEAAPTKLALDFSAPAPVESREDDTSPVATRAPTSLPGAEALTAALNRAQIDPTLAARASFAYGRAVNLTQLKLPDDAALVF